MRPATIAHWIGAFIGVLGFNASAQQISIADFTKRAEVYEVSMSPSGNHVALTIPSADGLETQLQIVPLDGSGKTQSMRFGSQMHVADVTWTADDQVVVSRARTFPLRAAPLSFGQLIASDITGKDQETLFGYVRDSSLTTARRKDEGFAWIEQVLDDEPGMALVGFVCWNCGEEPGTVVYRVDTRTGNRKEVERSTKSASFMYDRTGVARIRVETDNEDNPVIFYRAAPAAQWQPLPKALAGFSISGVRFDVDGNTMYASISDKGEPEQLYRFDLAAGTRQKLTGRDDVEVSYYQRAGRNGVPFAVIYDAAKPSVQYLDPSSDWAKLHAGVMKAFPGQLVSFSDFSRDNNKILLRVWSDRNPGAYYVFDRKAQKVQLIAEHMPWIKAEQVAPMRSIEFTSRDGRKLYGQYTANGTGPKPLIVLPHGGPHGPYDGWGYDADAQFLASRGYAVLQVNYRGSGGRGENFLRDGYREWGGKIQDDIADGVKWTIDNKLADPNRICTYGASFGGYAAMMQPIRNPGMYKCAIGYVGVYDLAVMTEEGDIPDSRFGRRYLNRAIGTDAAAWAANSPAKLVDQIKVPVFLAQGAIDKRVPMPQFNALKQAFSAAGTPIETMVVAGEGHGFYKPENRAELYRRIEAFLAKHIGPDAK